MQINFDELGFDDTDVKIFEFLSKNGRMKSTEIGNKLGVSHTAVDKRIKNLCEKKKMKVTAKLDLYSGLSLFEVTVYNFPNNKKNSISTTLSSMNFISQIFVFNENGAKYIKAFCYGNSKEDVESKFDKIKNGVFEFDFKVKAVEEKVKQIF